MANLTYPFQSALLQQVKEVYDYIMLIDDLTYKAESDDDHTVNDEWNDIKKTMERLVEKFGNSYDFV